MTESAKWQFILLSEARSRLRDGMFGNLTRPVPVGEMKRKFPRLSLGSGDWTKAANAEIIGAVSEGLLPVYVMPARLLRKLKAKRFKLVDMRRLLANRVDPRVLNSLIAPSGYWPDNPYRPSDTLVSDGLLSWDFFALLSEGLLVVPEPEFRAWYLRCYARGVWPSQRKPDRRRRTRGRPRLAQSIKDQITIFANEKRWKPDQGISGLRRLFEEADVDSPAPSDETLQRRVDELYLETQDPRFKRIMKRRKTMAKRNPSTIPQK
jgi:hypothetical protein